MRTFSLFKNISRLRTAALAAALLWAFPLPGAAAIVPTLNYQGYLISKVTNLPVDATQPMKFVIHDSALGVAAPLFSETQCSVRVSKGRYDAEIGSATIGGIPASIFTTGAGLWLEVQVDNDGNCVEPFEIMTPRIKLQSSPYSFSSVYATTSSVATQTFYADTIAALPTTTFGAITISSNLYVRGGISVGNISPGQKLAVAGVVESTGIYPGCADPDNYTCGFKFPDGSVQTRAAAFTMWDILGDNIFSINPGNVAIGKYDGANNANPLARLHISSGAGSAADLLMVSTGTSQLFFVNAYGEAHANSFHAGAFYGNGATLTGILDSAGDTMTGPLTLAGSSLTVTSLSGISSPRVSFAGNVSVSSASDAFYGGIHVSTHVYSSGIFYGNGSGLHSIVSSDPSRVLKAGDTMTGPLTLSGSTLTITGGAFSVGGSAFSVFSGSVAIGGLSYPARLSVTGGINATSSITAGAGFYSDTVNTLYGYFSQSITAATATFTARYDNLYSILSASSIYVSNGYVQAPYFVGDGSRLQNVLGTDSNKVAKAGDVMTGQLTLAGSTLTVAGNAFSVGGSTLVVRAGRVGVQIASPTAPLEVKARILVSNTDGPASLDLTSNNNSGYIYWSDTNLPSAPLGALGYPGGTYDLVYRTLGTTPVIGGAEVFRIKSDDVGTWRFGIGTDSPAERFHVATNLLVSTAAVTPLLYISTTTGRVSISTGTQTHALTVNGGINAVSSITAQGGFFGDGSGVFNISAGAIPRLISVSSITAPPGLTYDGVIFSTYVYAISSMSVGTNDLNNPFNPQARLHVRGNLRVDQKSDEPVVLEMYPNYSGDAYIRWQDFTSGMGGVLGMLSTDRDLVYRGGTGNIRSGGTQAFRIKSNGTFIIGTAAEGFVANTKFHVGTDMAVGASAQAPAFYVSDTGMVGISTGTPRERTHVGSSLLVGADRPEAALFVSTQTKYVGIGTGYPAASLDVSSNSVFGTSVTVTGRGLSGAQTALNVKDFALLVRGDGRVGVSTGAPQALLDVNGGALFASSVAVSGTGLAGSEDVLNVKSGALVVRNDGRVGIGSAAPVTTLEVNGSAQFGSGGNKSTFTAEGFWQPRWISGPDLVNITPTAVGQIAGNLTTMDLCVSTDTAIGSWAALGNGGVDPCY